jgi:protoheme IX farnesyltransferase
MNSLWQSIQNYKALSKPGIVRMVLVTTAIGFMLGETTGIMPWWTLVWTLLGTALAAGGSAALNNYIERDFDALMERTAAREIPSGKISPEHALAYGLTTTLLGVGLLAWQVNLLTAFIVLLTTFLYTLVYTPMKRISWLNTSIGAIPGALPIMSGWTASAGSLDIGAWVLFYILFAWQHPHFYAIAWMYREEYAKAGYKMLSGLDEDGRRLFRHALTFSVFLVAISLLPALTGLTGRYYLIGAVVLGVLMLETTVQLARLKTLKAARNVLRASIIYFPVLMVLIVADGIL